MNQDNVAVNGSCRDEYPLTLVEEFFGPLIKGEKWFTILWFFYPRLKCVCVCVCARFLFLYASCHILSVCTKFYYFALGVLYNDVLVVKILCI